MCIRDRRKRAATPLGCSASCTSRRHRGAPRTRPRWACSACSPGCAGTSPPPRVGHATLLAQRNIHER
eukprot:4879730-Alexandrium_andersonii.AAC.1